ncbi:MAG: hypothetical protein ACJ0G4_06895 [Alphaproteobacteria bacterium]|tara:strand:+ start:365 stop:652 length:288 start_codon:yes stop_codon:yes gene_type:complete
MKRFLKFTVIFLGVLIIILFSFTILTIFNKYKNQDVKISQLLELNPLIEDEFEVISFQINKKQIHLHLENKDENSQFIRSYDAKTGKLSNEIILK